MYPQRKNATNSASLPVPHWCSLGSVHPHFNSAQFFFTRLLGKQQAICLYKPYKLFAIILPLLDSELLKLCLHFACYCIFGEKESQSSAGCNCVRLGLQIPKCILDESANGCLGSSGLLTILGMPYRQKVDSQSPHFRNSNIFPMKYSSLYHDIEMA